MEKKLHSSGQAKPHQPSHHFLTPTHKHLRWIPTPSLLLNEAFLEGAPKTIISYIFLYGLGALGWENIWKGSLSSAQGEWIRSFITKGTGPTKNISCGSADLVLPGSPHDNGYVPDLDFTSVPTPTLSSKTGLKSLRSQAKPGSKRKQPWPGLCSSTLYRHQNKDRLKSNEITLKQWKQDVDILFRVWPKLRL